MADRSVNTVHPSTARNLRSALYLSLSLRVFLTAALPVLMTLLSARLVMTPLYLNLAYHLPGFPDDPYGLTREDRLHYAPYALDYMLSDAPISYLGDLRLAGEKCFPPQPPGTDCPLHNSSELRHMADVQVVTRYAFLIGLTLAAGAAAATLTLSRSAAGRRQLRRALQGGAIATLSIIAAIIIVAMISWNTFFNLFHELFFESGTWRFAYSDTLIRLFPEFFWFTAALAIGILTTFIAFGVLLLTWRWGVRALPASRPTQS